MGESPEGRGAVPAGVVALLAVYAVAFVFVPPLLRAAIAVAALGCLLHDRRWGGPLPAGGWGLLLLGLPLLASLQYYLGYPLRILAARLTVPLLGMAGVSVAAQGTGLLWRGELVLVDAPCSGLRMLWAGTYLALALAAWLGLPWRRTAAAALGGLSVVVAATASGRPRCSSRRRAWRRYRTGPTRGSACWSSPAAPPPWPPGSASVSLDT